MKESRMLFSSVPLCLIFASFAQAAAPVLDQQSPVGDPDANTFALGGPSGQILFQSLTVGLTGRLWEIRLPIGCESGEVILQVFDAGIDGLPLAGASARLSISYAAEMFPEIVTGDYQPLPLGGRLGVTAGESIVIVLSNPTGSCGIAAAVAGDPYPGGTGHADEPGSPFPPVPLSLSGTDDLPFQTFVRRTGPSTP